MIYQSRFQRILCKQFAKTMPRKTIKPSKMNVLRRDNTYFEVEDGGN
jgi:hypothetical protein